MLIGNYEFILILQDMCPTNCPSLRYAVLKVESIQGRGMESRQTVREEKGGKNNTYFVLLH